MITLPLGLVDYGDNPIALSTISTTATPCSDIRANAIAPVNLSTPVTIPTTSTALQTISVAAAETIQFVLYDSQSYRPAVNSADIQPGEFVYHSLVQMLEIRPRVSFVAGRSLQLITLDPQAVLTEQLITDVTGLPDIFTRYDLKGVVEWSLDWEGQPSGGFELLCDWATADALITELIPNVTQLEMFGIGFQVSSLKIVKRSPLQNANIEAALAAFMRGDRDFVSQEYLQDLNIEAGVSVSLRGKWESVLDDQVVIRSGDAQGGSRTIYGNTTVAAIGQKLGTTISMPPTFIQAPAEQGQDSIVSLGEVFEGNLRHNGCFADYGYPDSIRAVPLNAVPTHAIGFSDLFDEALDIQVNAYPRAFDYDNARLEWGGAVPLASTFLEDTQGKASQEAPPAWRQQPTEVREFVIGAPSLRCPIEITQIKDLSMTFDNGGVTREQTYIRTENEAVIREQLIRYGFAYIGYLDLFSSLATDNKQNWVRTPISSPASYWVPIEDVTTTYLYDESTGYLKSVSSRGWRLTRFRKEEPGGDGSMESLDAYFQWYASTLSESGADKRQAYLILLDAFEYFRLPVNEDTYFGTSRYRSKYSDIEKRPTEDYVITVPEFNSDGTRSDIRLSGEVTGRTDINGVPHLQIKQKVNVPGWVDPEFCELEASRKTSFARLPNPEHKPATPRADLATGEDKEYEKKLYVPSYQRSEEGRGETFWQFEKIQTQKDGGFSAGAKERTETANKGRPGEHTRKETKFAKIQPGEPEDDDRDDVEYQLTTTTVTDSALVGATLSFDYARNYGEALLGAQTEFAIANYRGTRSLTVNVPSTFPGRPGNRIALEGHGYWRIVSMNQRRTILAPQTLQPSPVELSLVYEVDLPTLQITRAPKVDNTRSPEDEEDDNRAGGFGNFDSGSLVSTATRGNA